MSRLVALALPLLLLAALSSSAQAPALSDVYTQIRVEETNNSAPEAADMIRDVLMPFAD